MVKDMKDNLLMDSLKDMALLYQKQELTLVKCEMELDLESVHVNTRMVTSMMVNGTATNGLAQVSK
jgi:H2-forming N5,N10-methylenetetrahydromethanopterin dehydrogenase-like enzyme